MLIIMYEIRLINLSKRYKNKEVFKNLNLDIKKGGASSARWNKW